MDAWKKATELVLLISNRDTAEPLQGWACASWVRALIRRWAKEFIKTSCELYRQSKLQEGVR